MRQVKREDILNGWLKYHNTTVSELIVKHPKEILQSPDWFKLYPVTQEQHDEWEKWAKEYMKKNTKFSKKFINKQWPWVYIDVAPSIIKDNNL